ncbi:hypothetical protein M8C21_027190, partial [Ambrosia artemisiifolia]
MTNVRLVILRLLLWKSRSIQEVFSLKTKVLIEKQIERGEFVWRTNRANVHMNMLDFRISDPLEEGCRLGHVVSAGQYEKVLNFVETAKREGTIVLFGGKRPQHLTKGFYMEPALITDVTTSMQIWSDEVFRPVLCVKTFSIEQEAIKLANDTHYGLGSAIISNDLEWWDRVAK